MVSLQCNLTDNDTISKSKILVVDDVRINFEILRRTLLPEGYKLFFANNGKTALELVSIDKPDLILMDLTMPELDGFETCSLLKNSENTKDIPVIFVTGSSGTDEILRGFELGCVDYITKPFCMDEVRVRVRAHIQLLNVCNQLKEKNQALIELNEVRNDFIGIAAHDLRNPLAIVCGIAELIKESNGNLSAEKIKHYIAMIHTSGKRMLSLVNDLLNNATIEKGSLNINIEVGSVKELIDERIELFKTKAQLKNIVIHRSLNDIESVLLDNNYISQVIDNLISNAIKFSEYNKNIYVTLEQQNSEAIVSVKDEGPGISLEDKSKLFEQFQRLSARPTAGEESTGLGLAIVKKIIDAHNGALGVSSHLGSGSTFSFTLPISGC